MLSEAPKRRPLSMTSLIDVIFLLLLFFMLTSTFSKFGEVPLRLGGAQGRAEAKPDAQLLLLRLTEAGLSLNGQATPLDQAPDAIEVLNRDKGLHLILSVAQGAPAQDFVNALHILGRIDGTELTVVK